MTTLILAFVGGIVGAVLMDMTEAYAAKIGLTSGVKIALVGRWFIGLTRGQLVHANILQSKSMRGEIAIGWAFHFLVGGGCVALLYPAFLQNSVFSLPDNHLSSGVVFGLATSLFPWLILLPSFGWGLFGQNGPRGSNALLSSMVSHIPYGLGVGAMTGLGSSF